MSRQRESWEDEERWSPEDEKEARWDALHGVPWAYQTALDTDTERE